MAIVRGSTRAACLLRAHGRIFRPFSSGTPESTFKLLGIPEDPPDYEEGEDDTLQKQTDDLKSVKSLFEKIAWRLPRSDPRRREFMEIFYRHPFAVEGSKCHFHVKEDDYAVYAREDMPGVDYKGVKVWMEKDNHLHFEGVEAAAATICDSSTKPRKFANRIYLPSGGRHHTDDKKQIFCNVVLRIVVSKIKA